MLRDKISKYPWLSMVLLTCLFWLSWQIIQGYCVHLAMQETSSVLHAKHIVLSYVVDVTQAHIDTYLNYMPLLMLGLWCMVLGVLMGVDKLFQRRREDASQHFHGAEIGYLRRLAFYDPITELPNREAFLAELSVVLNRAKRHHLHFSLCYMDCDDFKKINDQAGHHVGDGVLKHIADVVSKLIRKNDFFSRLSGDEFCLILEGTVSDKALDTVLMKLLHAIAVPVTIDEHVITVSMSMGVAVYPRAGGSIEELLIQADQAMYQAKRHKKGTYWITHGDDASCTADMS